MREETLKRTLGGVAEADFAVFPARHITAALNAPNQSVTAELIFPNKGPSKTVTVPVGTQEMRNVHMLLSY